MIQMLKYFLDYYNLPFIFNVLFQWFSYKCGSKMHPKKLTFQRERERETERQRQRDREREILILFRNIAEA